MKMIVVLMCAALCSGTAAAQKTQFHSQNYVGVLEGDARSAFQLLSINGLQRATWFAGLGTGLDYYFFRSVPLFLSITKFTSSSDRSFYFTADGGVNFVWDKTTANPYNMYRSDGEFRPSLYAGLSAGYKVGLKNKKDAILLNIGYSAKQVRETLESDIFCINPPCPKYYDRYNYKLNRLSLKIGWMF